MHKKMLWLGLWFWSAVNFALTAVPEMDCERHYCTAIVDVGSSGSRIHWYNYDKDRQNNPIHITDVFSKKIKPGLSTLKQDPDTIAAYLQDLMADFSQPNVPVFLYATAGMRLLSDDKQAYFYAEIKKWFTEHPQWPLLDARTISGKEEGVYGWLSLNYYLHTLQAKQHPLAGLIEIGGASAQVVFPVKYASLIDPIDVTAFKLYGRNLQVYSHSFLGLGANEIFNQSQTRYTCFSQGYPMINEGKANGSAQLCQAEIGKTLQEDYHVDVMTHAALQQNMSSDWYTVAAVPAMLTSFPFDFPNHVFTGQNLLQQSDKLFCQQQYQDLLAQYKDNEFVHKNCLLAAYFYSLLTQGLGLNAEQIIHYEPDYDGSWTLGALLMAEANDV